MLIKRMLQPQQLYDPRLVEAEITKVLEKIPQQEQAEWRISVSDRRGRTSISFLVVPATGASRDCALSVLWTPAFARVTMPPVRLQCRFNMRQFTRLGTRLRQKNREMGRPRYALEQALQPELAAETPPHPEAALRFRSLPASGAR
jgi:hypothetical protein